MAQLVLTGVEAAQCGSCWLICTAAPVLPTPGRPPSCWACCCRTPASTQVGSAEGWAPSSFKSSRGQRWSGEKQQSVEQYLDEDELEELRRTNLQASWACDFFSPFTALLRHNFCATHVGALGSLSASMNRLSVSPTRPGQPPTARWLRCRPLSSTIPLGGLLRSWRGGRHRTRRGPDPPPSLGCCPTSWWPRWRSLWACGCCSAWGGGRARA